MLAYIKVTNKCQLNCSHCYNAQLGSEASMSKENLDKAIAYIKANNIDEVSLHGGEPLLYPTHLLAYIFDNLSNCKITMTSNLVVKLTDDLLGVLRNLYPLYGKPFIQSSFDYDIRFNKKQQELWESNIKTLIALGFDVQVTVCVTNRLLEHTPKELYEYLVSLGIKYINFERLTLNGNCTEELIPRNIDMQTWLLTAYKVFKSDYDFLRIQLFESVEASLKGELIGCRARNCSSTVITINPDLRVSGCPNCLPYTMLGEQSKNQEECIKEVSFHTACLACKYFKVCNGDCYQLKHDVSGCPGLKLLYEYLTI